MQIKVLHNQTIFDIAIQHMGSVEGVPLIMQANDISISEYLTAGMSINIPSVIDQRVVDFYKTNIPPATYVTLTNLSFNNSFNNSFN